MLITYVVKYISCLWERSTCTRLDKEVNDRTVRVNGIVYIRCVTGALFVMNLTNTPAQGKCAIFQLPSFLIFKAIEGSKNEPIENVFSVLFQRFL